MQTYPACKELLVSIIIRSFEIRGSAASDLILHSLLMSHKKDVRLIYESIVFSNFLFRFFQVL